METYKIILMPIAEKDQKSITHYLNEFSLEIALDYYDAIDKTINSLETMPNRCPLVRNERLREKGVRWIGIRNYIAFFRVEEGQKIVRIERILYSAQEYDAIL